MEEDELFFITREEGERVEKADCCLEYRINGTGNFAGAGAARVGNGGEAGAMNSAAADMR